ncbi:hypothetical protein [Pedobacter steynii]|uniref:hypothetical protein n=1 Tax=Pedobacter steynii TaxID=430522 RepID=UPI0009F2524C|nr:hypothetical protein [Pedobacter steynii]
MKTIKLSDSKELAGTPLFKLRPFKWAEPIAIFSILLSIWTFSPVLLRFADDTAGNIDQSIWLLIVLSLMSFLLITGLSWWILQRFWFMSGLPSILSMVSQFNTLLLWQQISFFLASFALLLMSSTGVLIALC